MEQVSSSELQFAKHEVFLLDDYDDFILVHIFALTGLDVVTRVNLRGVCRRWRDLVACPRDGERSLCGAIYDAAKNERLFMEVMVPAISRSLRDPELAHVRAKLHNNRNLLLCKSSRAPSSRIFRAIWSMLWDDGELHSPQFPLRTTMLRWPDIEDVCAIACRAYGLPVVDVAECARNITDVDTLGELKTTISEIIARKSVSLERTEVREAHDASLERSEDRETPCVSFELSSDREAHDASLERTEVREDWESLCDSTEQIEDREEDSFAYCLRNALIIRHLFAICDDGMRELVVTQYYCELADLIEVRDIMVPRYYHDELPEIIPIIYGAHYGQIPRDLLDAMFAKYGSNGWDELLLRYPFDTIEPVLREKLETLFAQPIGEIAANTILRSCQSGILPKRRCILALQKEEHTISSLVSDEVIIDTIVDARKSLMGASYIFIYFSNLIKYMIKGQYDCYLIVRFIKSVNVPVDVLRRAIHSITQYDIRMRNTRKYARTLASIVVQRELKAGHKRKITEHMMANVYLDAISRELYEEFGYIGL